jgi:hypothetical protein
MGRNITVKAAWNAEAEVWYIEHSDLPGLHIEAGTPIALYASCPVRSKTCWKGAGRVRFRLSSLLLAT